jgi:XTP/dITP diphosphohydrolase
MNHRTHALTLLIATNNAGKVREYETLLAGLPVRLTTPADIGIHIDVEENGASFEENAVIKARAYAEASGLPTLADDSGLEVDAMGGAPGIYSARYAGESASDADRYRRLLAALRDVPAGERTARFQCVIAVAWTVEQIFTFAGMCEGIIGAQPVGSHGFGYDPVFYMPALGCTMAELAPALKDRVSHRARAAMRMRPFLLRRLSGEQLDSAVHS